MKRIFNAIFFLITHPVNASKYYYEKIIRKIKFWLRIKNAMLLGITFVEPNYIYKDTFDNSSILIDVGCASDPDLSKHMLNKYGLRAFGVDPTLKHAFALRALEENTKGRFKHIQAAVTVKDGKITFYETFDKESGSAVSHHSNATNEATKSYEVESVSLKTLLARAGVTKVDFLKLDLEGAEYELLKNITAEDLKPFKQLFVEFHHHCTSYSKRDTKATVQSLCDKGFRSFTLNDRDFLFFRTAV